MVCRRQQQITDSSGDSEKQGKLSQLTKQTQLKCDVKLKLSSRQSLATPSGSALVSDERVWLLNYIHFQPYTFTANQRHLHDERVGCFYNNRKLAITLNRCKLFIQLRHQFVSEFIFLRCCAC